MLKAVWKFTGSRAGEASIIDSQSTIGPRNGSSATPIDRAGHQVGERHPSRLASAPDCAM